MLTDMRGGGLWGSGCYPRNHAPSGLTYRTIEPQHLIGSREFVVHNARWGFTGLWSTFVTMALYVDTRQVPRRWIMQHLQTLQSNCEESFFIRFFFSLQLHC
jgi:hypothetical protein